MHNLIIIKTHARNLRPKVTCFPHEGRRYFDFDLFIYYRNVLEITKWNRLGIWKLSVLSSPGMISTELLETGENIQLYRLISYVGIFGPGLKVCVPIGNLPSIFQAEVRTFNLCA